mmetsp:Transcript_742/g.1282  ORF Transcript_742/g.1282 Transcript_742/m.1282 type:complete len:1166 (-) Transcript_742:127-3624(-)|eukprot:CAMPEP_0176489496 /NCGR_PEP_ID=MMETSP0200_2-20121128/7321_1 /TAXON_ID=947934 /ORGANISM="Chaetoceros sp., Strain GSL56" /LENGTH=1165 /DNA_ID=CAMNT_0017886645 /DNA_START=112 /DNA_END=3609 /DNA_ORIENTATION=+
MASPITLYIAPNTGIEVTIERKSMSSSTRSSSMFPGDLIKGCPYQLSNLGQIRTNENGVQDYDISRGYMSPIDNVTLPPYARELSGIKKEATKFAFLHPPKGLANRVDWRYYSAQRGDVFVDNDSCTSFSNGKEGDDGTEVVYEDENCSYAWAIPYISVTGAFVYFDDEYNVVSVNVITFQKTKYALNLSGAFKTPQPVVSSITETKRAVVIPLDAFHECSFVAMSWVRPYETFRGTLPSGTIHDNRHGSFVFLRYDCTAVTYAVSSSYVVDYTGESEIIPDTLSSQACRTVNFADMTFATDFVDDAMAVRWRKYITLKCEEKETGRRRMSLDIPPELKLERSLIHEACRSGVGLDCIKELLKDKVELDSLDQQDHFGWNPLHYACAFSPNDVALLKYLLELKPSALHQKDAYGRYPIHVLCDSGNMTLSAVQLLLATREGKTHILEPTKYLGRLPLHIAVNRGAPVEVIGALLDADETGRSIRVETHDGMRPIHAALGSKPSTEIIELLTSADSKVSEYENDSKADIFSEYKGLLPIHMACLNNSPESIVSLLLNKDTEGITLLEKASNKRSKSYHDFMLTKSKLALHYAISHSSDNVVRLFLNRLEIDGEATHSILDINAEGRCALHLACMKNSSPYIIKMLLKLDSDRGSVAVTDKDHLRPIHYACDHKDAQKKTVELLLKAEKEFLQREKSIPLSEKSPFWYASKAQAPSNVLELLVSQPGFSLRDFDRVSMRHDLADTIKNNPSLQRQINRKMARRVNFFKLSVQIILNFAVLFTFYVATEDCSQGCTRQLLSTILWSCVVIYALNEFSQMIGQTLRGYFLDLWNWYELTMISLLSFSIWSMDSTKANCMCKMIEPYERNVIMVTGILLVMNIIFSLRSLFLPFALFATGLVNIAITLIPFFIVSILVLAAFTQAYRVDVNFHPSSDEFGEDSLHGQCLDSFGGCFMAVLQGFFGGPDGTTGITDILYGILVVVVLLNVVIAIVSDSWEDSKAIASTAFWRSRINWLAESGLMQAKQATLVKKKIPFLEWIDQMKWIPLNDNISWNKDEPYILVKSRKQYEDPWYFFDQDIAKHISDGHTLESSLYWIKKDSESNDEKKMGVFTLYTHLAVASFCWYMNNFMYLILVIAGIPTFGLLWPIEFRLLLLSLGMDYNGEEEGE